MRHLSKLLPLFVIAGVAFLMSWAAHDPLPAAAKAREVGGDTASLAGPVAALNRELEDRWRAAQVSSARPAPDLQVLRRLSLALHGTIPSLEEIRLFEADDRPDRLEHWTRRLLADRRFADYFAERLARGFVGKEGGQFIVFRRDRFVDWLSDELQKNTPYDQVVRTMVSATGLWTGKPATNFITAAIADGELDENKLAAKSVRAFLGQRIDCAQCHDHPFADWKQAQFEGIAAFYGQVNSSVFGVEDKMQRDGKPVVYTVEDRMTKQTREVVECVPFHPEWLPADGTRRERLAAWIAHPENRRFERAIANRVWALLFGRGLREPVDDLPDPTDDPHDLLNLLGADFRAHGCDLQRLIQVIAASRPFRIDSEWDPPADVSHGQQLAALQQAETTWAFYPLIRLRPEQVIGSIRQSASIQTADQNAHWLFRTVRLIQSSEFIRDYGDLGADELQDRGGTVPQRLLMLNGERSDAEGGPLNAVGRIASLASTDAKVIETAYLVCLRRPTAEESRYFVDQLKDKKNQDRQQAIEDLVWTLYNGTEFSWNH